MKTILITLGLLSFFFFLPGDGLRMRENCPDCVDLPEKNPITDPRGL